MDITLERILTLLPTKPDGKFVRGSKKDFAVSIGYDSGDIVSMWINGSSTSYKGKLHEIADKYNVSVEWLKGETDIKEKSSVPEMGTELSEAKKALIQKIALMDDNMVQALNSLADQVLLLREK